MFVLREEPPKGVSPRLFPNSGECTSTRTSPYITILFVFPHFVEKKYTHGNVGTYKIGGTPPSIITPPGASSSSALFFRFISGLASLSLSLSLSLFAPDFLSYLICFSLCFPLSCSGFFFSFCCLLLLLSSPSSE